MCKSGQACTSARAGLLLGGMANGDLEMKAFCLVQEGSKFQRGRYLFRITRNAETHRATCKFEVFTGFQLQRPVDVAAVMDEEQLFAWADKVLRHPLAHRVAPHQALPDDNDPEEVRQGLQWIEDQWGEPRPPNKREFLGVKGETLSFGSIVVSFDGQYYHFKQTSMTYIAACELAAYIRSDRKWDSDQKRAAPGLRVRDPRAWIGDELRPQEPLALPKVGGSTVQQSSPTVGETGPGEALPTHYNSLLTLIEELTRSAGCAQGQSC